MGIIFELIIPAILEFLLELGGELIIELGLRSLGELFAAREERNPVLAGIGYAALGLVLGGLSLFVFPNAFVRSRRFHGISLLIAPVLAGAAMAGVGWLRERRGQYLIGLDSFLYGFIFALAMAIVRFLYTS